MAHAVDGADEVSVGDGVGGLLQLPQVFRQTRDGGGGVEDNFGAVQAQDASALGEVTVVADVDAHFGVARLKDGVAGVAGREVKLFPKARMGMRDVVLAVLAQVAAVGVEDGGGVVVHAGHSFFVDGKDNHHAVLFGEFLRPADRGAVGDALGLRIPTDVLFGAKVGPEEDLLQAENLYPLAGGLSNQALVLADHLPLDFFERVLFRREFTPRLNQTTTDRSCHCDVPPEAGSPVPTRRGKSAFQWAGSINTLRHLTRNAVSLQIVTPTGSGSV